MSQFTLYGQVIKGSKPDFHLSMKSETSRAMYQDFLERLKKAYHPDRIKGSVHSESSNGAIESHFVQRSNQQPFLTSLLPVIQDGEFGAMMIVNIANDGPVTLELDSRKFEYVPVGKESSAKPKPVKDAQNGNGNQNNKTKKGQNGEGQEKKERSGESDQGKSAE